MTVRRQLPDGSSYEMCAPLPGHVAVTTQDADGDRTVVTLDRAAARQYHDDFAVIAGLVATGASIGLEAALTGTAQRLFQRLRDLDKQNPAAADRIAGAIAAHLRSWRPLALIALGAP